MIVADTTHVIRRLRELEGWAQYIVESLTEDQRYERGKRERLEHALDPESLREVRELSRALQDKLEKLALHLEPTPFVPKEPTDRRIPSAPAAPL